MTHNGLRAPLAPLLSLEAPLSLSTWLAPPPLALLASLRAPLRAPDVVGAAVAGAAVALLMAPLMAPPLAGS